MWNLSRRLAAAGIAGLAALTMSAPSASAADIYDKYGYERYGSRAPSPYDDPRYADIYTHPAPPPAPHYVEPPRYERPYAYRDEPPVVRDRYGYLRPMQPGRYRTADPLCLPRGEIRRSLIDEGWREFQDLELRDDVAVFEARRPNGQLYRLKVDRCSGQIVHARPLDERPVPYAYRERYRGGTY